MIRRVMDNQEHGLVDALNDLLVRCVGGPLYVRPPIRSCGLSPGFRAIVPGRRFRLLIKPNRTPECKPTSDNPGQGGGTRPLALDRVRSVGAFFISRPSHLFPCANFRKSTLIRRFGNHGCQMALVLPRSSMLRSSASKAA